jgi:uncharacterized protein
MNERQYFRLIEQVESKSKLGKLKTHGSNHWRSVAWTGLELAHATPGADAEVIFLFALLHDSQRWSDWGDKGHGLKAAKAAKAMGLRLSKDRMMLLGEALKFHDDGFTDIDPTIGCCWDADRLQLLRVGVIPDPKYLSTNAAIQYTDARMDWASDFPAPSWGRILAVLAEIKEEVSI